MYITQSIERERRRVEQHRRGRKRDIDVVLEIIRQNGKSSLVDLCRVKLKF